MRDVSLSSADAAALQAIASTYVREAIQQAHRHDASPSAVADAAHWKRSAHYRSLELYRERLPMPPLAGTPGSSFPYDERKVGTRLFSDPALYPATLLLGAVRGDLDNVMFGLLAPSREALALQRSYVGAPTDGPVEERLLASVVAPSFHDPLRSLTLHWRGPRRRRHRHRRLPAGHGGLDALLEDGTVLVRSTGIAHLSDGQRVGYELVHSVALALAAEPVAEQGRKRADQARARFLHLTAPKLSFCSIYRQRGPDAVSVFSLGAATPRAGEKLAAFGADSGAKKMRALHRIEALGRAKKLAWLLATTGEPATLTSSARSRVRQSRSCCASCFKPFAAATGLGRRLGRLARLRGGRRFGTECSVCSDSVCGRCLVTRRLRFVRWRSAGDAAVATREVPFCVKCVQRSEDMSAATVAAHATLDEDDGRGCDLLSGDNMAFYGWSEGNTTPTCSSHKSSPSPPSNQTFFCIDDDDHEEEIPACDPQDGAEDECDAIGDGVSQRTWRQRWQRILTDDEAPVLISDVDDGDLWTLESLDVAILGDDAFQI